MTAPGRRGAAAVAAAVLVLTLSACAEPTPSPSPSPTRSGIPSGLPADVPILPGHVITSTSAHDDWTVAIRSAAPGRDYVTAMALLTKAGYRTTSSEAYPDNGQGQACAQVWCVDVSAYDDPRLGPSVAYEIYRRTDVFSGG